MTNYDYEFMLNEEAQHARDGMVYHGGMVAMCFEAGLYEQSNWHKERYAAYEREYIETLTDIRQNIELT